MPHVNEGELVRNVLSPWIIPDLKKLMFQTDKFTKIASRFPAEANWSHHRYIKIKLTIKLGLLKLSIVIRFSFSRKFYKHQNYMERN